jgi:hypothetical protein
MLKINDLSQRNTRQYDGKRAKILKHRNTSDGESTQE